MATEAPKDAKVIARNKKAHHDFFIDESYEAGIALVGSEVKSLREGKAVIADGFVVVKNGEAWLLNMQIAEYPWANRFNHAPKRDRKLLLHRREIEKLHASTSRQGCTALPLELYFKAGRVKVLVGVCRGKKQYDKREDARRRDVEREIDQAMKKHRR